MATVERAPQGEQRRIPAEERRVLVERAAGRVFAREGYAGARIEDIAAAAHVTKPIVYRHFDSKKALYMALLEQHERDLPSFFEAVRGHAADTPPEQLVRTILEHWLDYVRENQHAWFMLFRDSSGDAEIQALRLRVSTTAREVIAAFIAEQSGGRIPADQIEPSAEALTGGLASLALWWIDHPEVPKDVLVDVGARLSTSAVAGG
jgi:AcrR family transcriptional regulator